MEHDEYGKMLYDVYGIIGVDRSSILNIMEQLLEAERILDSLSIEQRSELMNASIAINIAKLTTESILEHKDRPIGDYS